ncbi:MAG TPA: hypothetical protein VM263_01090 [Acidimicrobiales bacterium]|nr:hypothetical protein [Acidimicrobiales bacterium]
MGLAPFSASATAVVLGAGVAAMAWGARLPPRPRPPLSGRGAIAWAALGLAAAAWQLAAYVQHPREDHPTISSLANALLDSRPARAAAFVAWLLAAAGLSRR